MGGAIKMLEIELRENECTSNLTSMVRVDHMAISLLKAYKSPIVDTIQSLPQHQQLNKYYIDLCKSTSIPPIGIMEFSCMCRVLGDQARGSILVASSPEIITRVKKRKVTNRPLAGTIRRGKTLKKDYMLENQLLHDAKQCAENIMLVDLGRNDVGKVKAIELIDKLEVTRRGPYSDSNKWRDWVARLQAKAGIVADSDPGDE
nr:hypothetical protein [Tanacetum cinerariifolium]